MVIDGLSGLPTISPSLREALRRFPRTFESSAPESMPGFEQVYRIVRRRGMLRHSLASFGVLALVIGGKRYTSPNCSRCTLSRRK